MSKTDGENQTCAETECDNLPDYESSKEWDFDPPYCQWHTAYHRRKTLAEMERMLDELTMAPGLEQMMADLGILPDDFDRSS